MLVKKLNLLIVLIYVGSSIAFAQQDTTLVYANPGYNKDPFRAKLKQKVEEVNGLSVVSLYEKKNVLVEKISYEDKKLEIRSGLYNRFEGGSLKEEGNYNKGYKHGEWKYYYPNHQVLEKITYAWDKLNGLYEMYWDNGKLSEKGDYRNGKKIGLWQKYDKEGKPIEGFYFDEKGKVVDKQN